MKKLYLGLAAMMTSLTMAPAVMAVSVKNLGTVKNVTAADTLTSGQPTVVIDPSGDSDQQKAEKVTITYEAADLKLVDPSAPGATEARPAEAAWLGIQVTAPSEINSQEAAEAVKVYDGSKELGNLYTIKDNTGDSGTYFVNIYTSVTQKILEDATKAGQESIVLASYGFDWDGEEGIDQTFEVVLNTMAVNLADTGGQEIFTTEMAEENVDEWKAAQAAANQPEENENPNTADNIGLYVVIAAVAVLGLGATAVVAKKSNR